jgi:hypothetical protein
VVSGQCYDLLRGTPGAFNIATERRALELWAARLSGIVEPATGAPANVVKLPVRAG